MPKQDIKVLIVGAGLGGLMLATLLERAGIAYEIFERAAEVRPLGSALSLGANVFYIFQQLGLLDELRARAKPFGQTRAFAEGHNTIRIRDYSPANEIAGFLPHIIARPDLYSLLQSQIPRHKLHHSKRVLALKQSEDGVSITCADKSTYTGTVLVGADGAYSSVRQRLYQQLQEQGILPESDQDSDQLPFSSVCLVGQTRVLDQPEDKVKFGKVVGETLSRFDVIVGNHKPYTLHPSAGLGAVSAIHDAVVLANVLHDLPTSNPDDITHAFETYREERYPLAKISWDTSHKMSTLLGNVTSPSCHHFPMVLDMKTIVNMTMRFLINYMPRWVWLKVLTRMYGYRPQVSFLPLAKDIGAVPPAPQQSLKTKETKAI
ncbi:hypothetical protein EC968_010224 [Mortierella alpina]|nr:hypothetical protein EC968_010224 [Mortierella alpina]